MILDLSVFREETLDITMMDGQVIHVRKPGQGMVIELIKLRDINEHTEAEKALAALDGLTAMILNDNTDGVHFEPESVRKLSLKVKQAILNAYTAFMLELQGNPT